MKNNLGMTCQGCIYYTDKKRGWQDSDKNKMIEVLMENQPGVVVSPVKVGDHDEQQKRGDLR